MEKHIKLKATIAFMFLLLSAYIIADNNSVSAQSAGDTGTDEGGFFTWVWDTITETLIKVYNGGMSLLGTGDTGTTPTDILDKPALFKNVTVIDYKTAVALNQEKVIAINKVSKFNDFLVVSLKEQRAVWFPDNHPLNNSKNLTFEFQIENLRTGENMSLRGNAIVPKYYGGSFIFNSSDKSLVTFTDIKQPTISFEYSTTTSKIARVNITTEMIYDSKGNEIEEKIFEVPAKTFINYQTIKPTELATFITTYFDKMAYQDPDVSVCGDLSTANGLYTLTADVNSSATCFNVLANNITINGAGRLINYSTASATITSYGVNSSFNSTQVLNARIIRGVENPSGSQTKAIFFNGVWNGTIFNNTLRETVGAGSGSQVIWMLRCRGMNISYNNIHTGTTAGIVSYGIYSSLSHNNSITDNFINSTAPGGVGIYLEGSQNNIISRNAINTTKGFALFFALSGTTNSFYNTIDNTNLNDGYPINYTEGATDGTMTFNNNFGQIIIARSTGVKIESSNINQGDGLFIYESNNTQITNNSINITHGTVVYLGRNANHNIFTGNNMTLNALSTTHLPILYSTSGAGTNRNNSFFNNEMIYKSSNSVGQAMSLDPGIINTLVNYYFANNHIDTGNTVNTLPFAMTNSTFFNNTFTGTPTTTVNNPAYLVSVYSRTVNVTFINNTFSINNPYLYFIGTSAGITIFSVYGGTMTYPVNSLAIGIAVYTNLTMQDVLLNSSNAWDINVTGGNGGVGNITNVKNLSGSPVRISWKPGINATYYVNWYLDVNVTNSSGSPIQNANVTVLDTNGVYQFSELTGADGLIVQKTLNEYVQNDTIKLFKTNYTVNITATGYVNQSISLNLTTSTKLNISLAKEGVVPDTTPPNVTFNTQVPADLNLTSFIGPSGVNITYNITDNVAVNLTTIKLYYKSNDSISNVMYYQNGTAHSGYFSSPYIDNVSSTFRWNLLDNAVLQGVYNFGEISLENTIHNGNALSQTNEYLSVELLNVSNSTHYSFYEIMANSTDIMRFYYCNSTYAFSNSPAGNPNCLIFYTEPAGLDYDHIHTAYSKHHVIPFTINETSGKLGTISVTPISYFILRGAGTTQFYTITNGSRTNAFRTTSNNGLSWTSQTYTVDAHLHQFKDSSSLWYYACANDTANPMNINCTAPRQDLFELAGLPPTQPNVYSPNNSEYYDFININYTASVSPNNYDIVFYNISLLNIDLTFNQTIRANNSNNLSYRWNITSIPNGNYIIKVEAYDNLSQSSFGLSENFTINNDYLYPSFSNFWDNNGTINGSGIGLFNVTVLNTNGTVWLVLNNTNYSADNLTTMNYNVSAFLYNGTYSYYWAGLGNGTSHHYNQSATYYYTINNTIIPPETVPPTFTNCRNFTQEMNQSFSQSITATDASGIGSYKLNDTSLFNVNAGTGLIINISALDAIAIHYLNLSVNDTLGNQADCMFWINITNITVAPPTPSLPMPLCQEQTDIADIPCLGLTSSIGCAGNVSVLNLNTSLIYNVTTTSIGAGIYNFTFDFPKGAYSLMDCENRTSTITVGYFAGGFGATQLGFMIPEIMLIFLLLFISGKITSTEEGNAVKPSRYFIGASLIVCAFLVMLFMTATVNTHLQTYITYPDIAKNYDYFNAGLMYMFYVMCALNILVFLSYIIKGKHIENADKTLLD